MLQFLILKYEFFISKQVIEKDFLLLKIYFLILENQRLFNINKGFSQIKKIYVFSNI